MENNLENTDNSVAESPNTSTDDYMAYLEHVDRMVDHGYITLPWENPRGVEILDVSCDYEIIKPKTLRDFL